MTYFTCIAVVPSRTPVTTPLALTVAIFFCFTAYCSTPPQGRLYCSPTDTVTARGSTTTPHLADAPPPLVVMTALPALWAVSTFSENVRTLSSELDHVRSDSLMPVSFGFSATEFPSNISPTFTGNLMSTFFAATACAGSASNSATHSSAHTIRLIMLTSEITY